MSLQKRDVPSSLRIPASITDLSMSHCCIGDKGSAGAPAGLPALPPGLKRLSIDLCTACPCSSVDISPLPQTQRHLRVHLVPNPRDPEERAACQLGAPLPPMLETLAANGICHSLAPLPASLRELDLMHDHHFNSSLGPLPADLSVLRLGDACHQELGPLPSDLKRLAIFCQRFSQQLGTLPSSLEQLYIPHGEALPPLGLLPPGLSTLVLPHSNSLGPLGSLPDTLHALWLPDHYNHAMHDLPSQLQSLTLGSMYSHALQQIPESLKFLGLGDVYKHPLPPLPHAHVYVRP